MPPKKLEKSRATIHKTIAALVDYEDLMLCVLARLPVKSIFRFKSVSFIIHRVYKNHSNTISVFNIDSNEKKPRILHTPFNYTRVGCCNGLVCIRRGQGFILWNPAMNLSKTVSPLKDHESVRLGLGYDAEGDDFKVVRILFKNKRRLNSRMCVSCVEVYSVNSDSWTTIDPDFQFSKLKIYRIKNSATVNGNPYWVGKVNAIEYVLVCFDMSKLVFKIVPLSTLDYNEADVEFVDLNGSLGAIVFTWRKTYVDVWVFHNVEQVWTKSHSVPIEVKMDRVLRCLKDGRVLGKRPKGQLIVFDSKTKCVKGVFTVGHDFEINDYTATLARPRNGALRKGRHALEEIEGALSFFV
ncbi:hypothetical protein CASFOL_027784 [Castilleja foliolosa]|uniref:F-box associated beta-propeller type 1 domain-containing protein n=1 Tax=Castilleja foliolosa TaxID=1961234 RepID=A0ABD3CFT5_9LAMI